MKIQNQKVTLNDSSQAGHEISLEPGLGFSLSRRSQAGHEISTLTTFEFIVN
tara:strand:- start:115 stop:270 length:156 start_codon:yes stop_codon:yes gene_type:complete